MKKGLIIIIIYLATGLTFSQTINLDRGLIAYYPFDGNTEDLSGYNNQGVVNGAEYDPEARCGDGAYYFNGLENSIDFGNGEVYNKGFRGLTISAMFRPDDDTPEDFQLLIGKWAFDAKNDQFALFLNVNYKLSFSVADGVEFGLGLYSHQKFETHKWYHIVVIWNRSRKMGIFINGKLDKMGEQHGDGYNPNSNVSLKMGRQIVGQDRPFKGYLDQVRVYNRSLSIAEVRALYRMDNAVCNQFTLMGNVYNKNTNEPIEATIIFEDLDTGEEFISIKSEPEYGFYETILPIGYRYAFYAKAKNYISINQNVSTANVKHNSVIEQDLYLVPLEVGGTVRLNNIFFETAKADLKEESAAELNRLIGLLNQIKGLVVEIGGHTDSVGSDAYNLNLSNLRAGAVRDYLLEHSIDTARVVSKGYGETVPVDTNDTDEGRQQNRRVEFKILGLDGIQEN